MTSRAAAKMRGMEITCVTIDCREPGRVAAFWNEALGGDRGGVTVASDGGGAVCRPAGGDVFLEFVRVPEAKTVKNRVHLDLQPDTTRDTELERLTGLGARLIDDQRRPDGTGWVVLADPAGNEFCVERSAAERG